MNPKNQIAKKRDEHKKEIRKEQIQKKRVQFRKALPYYDALFNKSDEDSNATNSRSSRFPVPSKNSKLPENANEQNPARIHYNNFNQYFGQDQQQNQRQMRYIEELHDLKNFTREQRHQVIEEELKKHYGNNCFDCIDDLKDRISYDITVIENELLSENQFQALDKLNWRLMLAILYLAENQQDHRIEQVCLDFITNYFIMWYETKIYSKVTTNMPIADFLNILSQQDDIATVQNIVLSHFITLKSQGDIDQESVQGVINYFGQKLQMYEAMQKHLHSQYPDEEVQYFSQILYNFPSLYFMESLAETVCQRETSTNIKVSAFTLLNKYYSGYPQNVESGKEGQQKFHSFISFYIKQLCIFMKLCLQTEQYLQMGDGYLELIRSSLKIVNSMIYKVFDEQMIVEEMDLFVMIVNTIIGLNITSEIPQFIDMHIEVLHIFSPLYCYQESVEGMFNTAAILDYFNSLLLEWHTFKFENRRQCLAVQANDQIELTFMKFELKLIRCLHVIKQSLCGLQIEQKCMQYIQSMLNYADMVYEKELLMLMELNGNSHECITRGMFLFQNNIRDYMKMFKNQTNIFNPETNEQYTHSDIQI